MDFSIEHKGLFYLPSNEEDKISGVIRLDSDGSIILDLIEGYFDTHSVSSINKIDQEATIVGYLYSGKKVTLLKCFPQTIQFQPRTHVESYHVNILLEGVHFNSFGEVAFKSFGFSSINLGGWINQHNIKHEAVDDGFLIKYKHPAPIIANITNSFSVIITTKSSRTLTQIEEKSYVQFDFDSPIQFDELLKKQFVFMALLELAIGKRQVPIEDYAIINDESVNIYSGNRRKSAGTEVKRYDMLFSLSEIGLLRWEDAIKKWYETYEQRRDVYNWYFSLCLMENSFIEQKFLHFTQFLESYHRKAFPLPSCEKKRRRERIQNILENIPNVEDREFINGKLLFAHEDSFYDRILDLLNKCSLCDELLSGSDRKSLAKKIKLTRNYFTHFTDRKAIFTGDEMFKAIPRLNVIVQYFLLGDLLFTEEERHAILSPHIRQIVSWL